MVGAGEASHSYCSGFKAFHRTTNTAMVSNHICFWVIFPRPFITINSAGECSLLMSLFWIGGCPTGWACCYFVFGFLCIGSQTVPKVKFILWSTTTTPSSSFSSFYLLLSHSGFVTSTWTLIHGSCTLLALQNSMLKSSVYYPITSKQHV